MLFGFSGTCQGGLTTGKWKHNGQTRPGNESPPTSLSLLSECLRAARSQPEPTRRSTWVEVTPWESPFIPRKEVIQPHLPVRLPCYDFTPITDPTFDACLPHGVSLAASG